jgi:hypothetical protein
MSIDSEWFMRKIQESHHGSIRNLAPHIKCRSGKKMDAPMLSRMISGERAMLLTEAVQLSELLDLSLDQIVAHVAKSKGKR